MAAGKSEVTGSGCHLLLTDTSQGATVKASSLLRDQETTANCLGVGWSGIRKDWEAPGQGVILTHAEREGMKCLPQHRSGTLHAHCPLCMAAACSMGPAIHKVLLGHALSHTQHNVKEQGQLRRGRQ